MTPQQLHDALGELSDDLLQEADALRKPRKQPWGTVAALAACVCLAVGIGLFAGTMQQLPVAVGQENAPTQTNPITPESLPVQTHPVWPDIFIISESDPFASTISSNSFRALILEAKQDHLVVRVTTGDDCFQADRVLKVYLPAELVPIYTPGDTVKVFYSGLTTPTDADSIQALGIVPIE